MYAVGSAGLSSLLWVALSAAAPTAKVVMPEVASSTSVAATDERATELTELFQQGKLFAALKLARAVEADAGTPRDAAVARLVEAFTLLRLHRGAAAERALDAIAAPT